MRVFTSAHGQQKTPGYNHKIPDKIMTPDKVETRIGTLDFTDGRPSDAGLEREDAIEVFYNASVTSWLNATLDLQIIEPALKKNLSSSGQLTDIDTTVVAGLRFYVRFQR